jgi:Fur family ferric uptake transcriptional regulator
MKDLLRDNLHKKGFRITKPRQEILDVLSGHPQSVAEIFSVLKKSNVNIDKVTVYRTLDCFTHLGIVDKTQFKDKTAKFELVSRSDHHHHLVCDICGEVEDIPLDEEILLKQVTKHSSFQVNSHSLEFFGICSNCQQ